MKVSLFSLLLLMLTPGDDAVAWSTPGGDDDIVAAANNHYLGQRRDAHVERAQAEAAPLFTLVPCIVPACLPAPPACLHAERGSARGGTLYTFMSLRC
jgi:hypothetical protein